MDNDQIDFLVNNNLISVNYTSEDLKKFEILNANNIQDLGKELVEIVGGVSELPEFMQKEPIDYDFYALEYINEGLVYQVGDKFIRKYE